ncbi:MAG: MATE family efflux transporter [Planctomycetota bacterium]
MPAPREEILAGPLDRPLLQLALPMLGGYAFQIGFNYVDAWYVGKLGPDALAGVLATMFVVWSLFALAEVVTVGVLARVANQIGAGQPHEAGAVVLTGILLSAVLAALVPLLGVAALPELVGLMGLEPVPGGLAQDYLRVLLLGYPTLIGFFLLESVFRGAGDTRTPMTVLAVCFLLNAALDRALIFGAGPIPALGVQGAALATVLSRGVGCTVLALVLWRRHRDLGIEAPQPGWLQARRAIRLVRIGAPSSVAGLCFCAIYLGLVRVTAEFGTPAVAALGLGLRLEALGFFVALSLGRAAATMAGQNLGARQPERARAAVRRAELLGAGALVPFVVVMLLLPEHLVRVFSEDPRVIEAAALYLRVVSWSMFPLAAEVVLDNVAGGVGDTVPAMLIEVLGTGLRLPLAWGLLALGVGYGAVWWCIALTVLIKAVAFELWFRRTDWATRVGAD